MPRRKTREVARRRGTALSGYLVWRPKAIPERTVTYPQANEVTVSSPRADWSEKVLLRPLRAQQMALGPGGLTG